MPSSLSRRSALGFAVFVDIAGSPRISVEAACGYQPERRAYRVDCTRNRPEGVDPCGRGGERTPLRGAIRSFMADTLRKMSNEIVHAATVFVVRSGNNARLIHAAFHRGKRWCRMEHRLEQRRPAKTGVNRVLNTGSSNRMPGSGARPMPLAAAFATPSTENAGIPLLQSPALHLRLLHHRPKCAPPSTCNTSPVTWLAWVR